MKKSAFAGLCCTVLVVGMSMFGYGAQDDPQAAPSVSFPEPTYTFDAVFEGVSVPHEFIIENKGKGLLDVKRVAGG